ncbi:MAG: amino acid permease [Lewinellaceae bacterium]|nr:amino acid permease [Saprospiraceae bacterium]MCB9313771.1 amino acid permease [Lewinellaceae bacterium]HRW74328.1 amino acid permease [Saprospiraceae bacterium]
MPSLTRKIGARSATALVIANMIGTGVFTSLGFQLADTTNTVSILLLWCLGGAIALAGAFSYAELGAAFRRSGGEYHYLSQLYHPLVGYLSGWVSLTVGFAAPVALAAMAMAAYLAKSVPVSTTGMATAVIVLVTVIHSVSIRRSSRFQLATTALKVLLILGFVALGLVLPPAVSNALDWSASWQQEIMLPAFAVSLVYVTYAYSGWNAAAYIVDEIRQPARNLPRALILGTLLVTVLYVLLQGVFLRQAGLAELTGKVEVGQVVATQLFGQTGGDWVSLAIALFLVSSISAMVWVGPRVSLVMAEDHRFWQFLRQQNRHGIPVRALWFQSGLSILLVWTGTFEEVLLYCGFILQLFAMLAVLGTFLLRRKQIAMPYQNPTHPWLPALFILASLWILGFLLWEQPEESLFGLANLAVGWITYRISSKQWL